MSWIDNLNQKFIIVTGDGKNFHPFWTDPSKSIEFNVTEFDFPRKNGTKVERTTYRGTKMNLTFYFQGEDHLIESQTFENSSKDPRPWTLTHPYYGTMTVTPLSIVFDNTKYNVTKIIADVMETITEDIVKITQNPTDKITQSHAALSDRFSNSFANDIKPNAGHINRLSQNTSAAYAKGKKIINLNADSEKYFNLFNDANAAINKISTAPLDAIRKVQAVLNAPALFITSVKNRINSLIDQFKTLRDTIKNIANKGDKKIYENNAGSTVSSFALAAITNPDYENRNDVASVIQQVQYYYNQYLSDLDSLQDETASSPDSYVPDAETLIALNDLINFTLANLSDIAINSKQERAFILESDSNLIMIAHRLYGLQSDDSTINSIMSQNNITLNELLSVRKGRKIVYYI